jgi:hypothetical protein
MAINFIAERQTKFEGKQFRHPATIYEDSKYYYISSAFEFKDKLKVMQGSKWLGRDEDNPMKVWRVNKSRRNEFRIEHLEGKNPFSRYDASLESFVDKLTFQRPVYTHQKYEIGHILLRKQCILAAEMGCVDGEALVHVNRAGKGFEIKLKNLFEKFHNLKGRCWDLGIETYIRSNCAGILKLNKIKNVLSKGKKSTLKIKTKLGYEICVTLDHEIAVNNNTYISAEKLNIGDEILVNGKWKDKDGYIRVGGLKNKHPRWSTGGVYEHILIMEEHLGRYIKENEIVHHKNEIKNDNKIENLELLSSSSKHAKLHGQTNYVNLHTEKCQFIPHKDKIISIENNGELFVYDVICDDPYRNFVANGIVVHNCGKTLASIEAMERSGIADWWYIGTKSSIASVRLEFWNWKSFIRPIFMTYDELKKTVENWIPRKMPPRGIIFDESSKLKTPTAQRSQSAFHVAESMRNNYGHDAYIVLMSGSPAPKSPVDWYWQCETACPGFLIEGDVNKFKERLAVTEYVGDITGGRFPKFIAWRDGGQAICNKCGKLSSHANHYAKEDKENFHEYIALKDEISQLYRRMSGLVLVQHKKDCLDLPDKVYREINIKPSLPMIRAASLIQVGCRNAIEALTKLRELSDGFQYIETVESTATCTTCKGNRELFDNDLNEKIKCPACEGRGTTNVIKREVKTVDSPKFDTLTELLSDDFEDENRIVIYGAFTGTIDRVSDHVTKLGWQVMRVDGRGWVPYGNFLPKDNVEFLKVFQNPKQYDQKIAFVGHAGSAGMGLTLTASKAIIYFSNDFNGESRLQSEDRIHRAGMSVERGATIIDLLHLPTDAYVLKNLKRKRDLQSLSMGLVLEEMKQAQQEAAKAHEMGVTSDSRN